MDRPRIGISRCLLGDGVRYDGGHKRDELLVDIIGRFVEWVPVCPEVEIGMGTPREAIHLVASADGVPSGNHRVRLIGVESGRDWTSSMDRWRRRRLRALADAGLAGYVLKKDSPSCGLERVPVHRSTMGGVDGVARSGRGLFAQALVDAMPNIPVEEDASLRDPRHREYFVELVFAYDRVRRFFAGRWTIGGLVAFHAAHELQLLSHSREAYRALGLLVARARALGRRETASRYERAFMDALRRLATPARHANVMMYTLRHFWGVMDEASHRELMSLVDDYRRGFVPLVVPIAMIRHHARQYGLEYLAGQVYLDPHPRELYLRKHV